MSVSFLRRVFGRAGHDEVASMPSDTSPAGDVESAPAVQEPEPVEIPAPVLATCPSCGYPLDPPPERNRRCPSCREQIVVRRIEGRLVYLTEAAVVVFDRERQRIADDLRWTTERAAWLALATGLDAAPGRVTNLAAATLSQDVVEAARQLYMTAADQAVRAARGAKHWNDVARIRREEAAALFHAAGDPVPPPDDIAGLHREGMLAELRALAVDFKDAELVGAGCCRPCRDGDGKPFKIADELRTPRLPHEGCPKGLCGCEWWLAMPGPKSRRRTRKSAPKPVSDGSPVAGDDVPELPAADV